MEERIVDQEITLIPYFPNEEVTLAWYQNPDICKQVDNIDYLYTPERLKRMYDYLSSHGQCYYIQYCGTLGKVFNLGASGKRPKNGLNTG